MTKFIYFFADVMGKPLPFFIFAFCGVFFSTLGVVLNLGEFYVAVVNITISNLTMIIGQAVLVSAARDNAAMHVKFDRIIEALEMENDAIGLEHEDAKDIEDQRSAIEQRST